MPLASRRNRYWDLDVENWYIAYLEIKERAFLRDKDT